MRVSVQSTGGLQRRVEVALPSERVEQMFKTRMTHFARTARLKGFRPGKVPMKVVEQQFGAQLRQDLVSELVRSSFDEAIAQEKLEPVGGPRIETLSANVGEELTYAAVFEVYPTVVLTGLDSLSVEKPEAEVTSADVDAMIENLRRQRVSYNKVDRAATSGDRVTVDFEGKLDDVAFEGGKGENTAVILGAGRMLPDFEKGLEGATAGATVTFPVNFPVDYGQPALAGRTAQFTATVSEVAEEEMPTIDDEFCLAFGVAEGGVEQLRREVEENMRRELASTVKGRLKNQLFEAMLAANPIEVPATSLESQIQRLQVDWLRRMGVSPDQIKEAPPREPFEATARRRVALGILIDEIAKGQQMQPDAAKIEEHIEIAAMGYGDPEDAARQIRDNAQLMSQVHASVIEEQVGEWLLAKAQVTSKPSSFKEVMNFGA